MKRIKIFAFFIAFLLSIFSQIYSQKIEIPISPDPFPTTIPQGGSQEYCILSACTGPAASGAIGLSGTHAGFFSVDITNIVLVAIIPPNTYVYNFFFTISASSNAPVGDCPITLTTFLFNSSGNIIGGYIKDLIITVTGSNNAPAIFTAPTSINATLVPGDSAQVIYLVRNTASFGAADLTWSASITSSAPQTSPPFSRPIYSADFPPNLLEPFSNETNIFDTIKNTGSLTELITSEKFLDFSTWDTANINKNNTDIISTKPADNFSENIVSEEILFAKIFPPSSGSISPGTFERGEIRLYGLDVVDTTYQANLTITSNDPAQPVVHIPITLNVVQPVGIETPENSIADKFELIQNYPNPFNPETMIEFKLMKASTVNLTVYNSLGELIATLVNRHLPAGTHKTKFDAQGLTSGVYYYRIETANFTRTKKMLFVQ